MSNGVLSQEEVEIPSPSHSSVQDAMSPKSTRPRATGSPLVHPAARHTRRGLQIEDERHRENNAPIAPIDIHWDRTRGSCRLEAMSTSAVAHTDAAAPPRLCTLSIGADSRTYVPSPSPSPLAPRSPGHSPTVPQPRQITHKNARRGLPTRGRMYEAPSAARRQTPPRGRTSVGREVGKWKGQRRTRGVFRPCRHPGIGGRGRVPMDVG